MNSESTLTQKHSHSKRAKMVKQLLGLVNDLGHDIFICLRDRKSDAVTQFSNAPASFRVQEIGQLNKNATVHRVEKFHSKICKLQDRRQSDDKEEPNESTSDTKTLAPSPLVASQPIVTPAEILSQTRYTEDYIVPQIKNEFGAFDQKPF